MTIEQKADAFLAQFEEYMTIEKRMNILPHEVRTAWAQGYRAALDDIVSGHPCNMRQVFKMEKGKWYVCDTSRYTDFIVGKTYYCPKNGMLKPNENEIARYVARDCFHLWTIKDARDGDVLVYNNSSVEIILLFKKWMNGVGGGAYSYAHTFNNEILFNDWSDCGYATHPATKEQRDLLFQKMKEAGYEWDADKKELKLPTQREKTPYTGNLTKITCL